MKVIAVRNATRKVDLGRRIRVATSLVSRAVGLLATASLRDGEGIYITPCRSIHTFFMRFPIDAAFIDSEGTILHHKTFKPWRFSSWHPKACGVLEFPAGTLARTGTRIGDRIEMKDMN